MFSVSILPDLMLLVIGVRKRAVHKECLVLRMKCIRPGPHGGFVSPREGGCSAGVFESLIIFSLWN